jgi:hypothetical protein
MMRGASLAAVAGIATVAVPACGQAAEPGSGEAPKITGSVTGFHYAMRDQPDFGIGVAAIDRGPLDLEARYNYEAKNSTSAFFGWKLFWGRGADLRDHADSYVYA